MEKRRCYPLLFLTFLFWGGVYVFSKIALKTISPIMVLTFRYLIGSIVLSVILKIKGAYKPVKKEDRRVFVLVGLFGYYLASVLQILSTKYLEAAMASLLNSLNPIFIPILAAIILKERLSKLGVLSIAVSITGVYIILGARGASVNLFGAAMALASVTLWSLNSVTIRRISSEYDPVQIALFGMLISLACCIPTAALEYHFTPSTFSATSLLSCLYLGIFGTAAAHTLWNICLKRIDASFCSMFYPLQPFFSAILGILFLHEVITKKFIVGGILISIGIVITVLSNRERKKRT